jgi:hypothetical protein
MISSVHVGPQAAALAVQQHLSFDATNQRPGKPLG